MREYDFPIVGDILTGSVQETLGSTGGTIDALSNESLVRELARIDRQFIRAAHTKHDNKGWSWMEKVHHFKTYPATALNGAVSAGVSPIIVDSVTGFLTAGGQLYILTSKGLVDFVSYIAPVAVSLPITPATLDVDHVDGEWVELLYDLPSDFAKEKSLLVNQSGYEYQKYMGALPYSRSYTVYNGSILFPKGIGSQDCTLVYEKQPVDLDLADTSAAQALSMDIPTDFIRYVTESLNAYIFMKKRRREDAQISLQLAEGVLRDALAYDINSALNGGLRTDW